LRRHHSYFLYQGKDKPTPFSIIRRGSLRPINPFEQFLKNVYRGVSPEALLERSPHSTTLTPRTWILTRFHLAHTEHEMRLVQIENEVADINRTYELTQDTARNLAIKKAGVIKDLELFSSKRTSEYLHARTTLLEQDPLYLSKETATDLNECLTFTHVAFLLQSKDPYRRTGERFSQHLERVFIFFDTMLNRQEVLPRFRKLLSRDMRKAALILAIAHDCKEDLEGFSLQLEDMEDNAKRVRVSLSIPNNFVQHKTIPQGRSPQEEVQLYTSWIEDHLNSDNRIKVSFELDRDVADLFPLMLEALTNPSKDDHEATNPHRTKLISTLKSTTVVKTLLHAVHPETSEVVFPETKFQEEAQKYFAFQTKRWKLRRKGELGVLAALLVSLIKTSDRLDNMCTYDGVPEDKLTTKLHESKVFMEHHERQAVALFTRGVLTHRLTRHSVLGPLLNTLLRGAHMESVLTVPPHHLLDSSTSNVVSPLLGRVWNSACEHNQAKIPMAA